jgi:hypothetical protein
MLAHAKALPIILARAPSTPVAMRPVELLVGLLRATGLPPELAMAGMNALAAAVRGVVGMSATHPAGAPTAEEREAFARSLPPETFPNLREGVRCGGGQLERDFEFGIRALARGLIASA